MPTAPALVPAATTVIGVHIAPISVVIPCYRCAKTVGRAVDSVTRQTVRPLELILIEDASGDNTLGTLLQLQRKHGEDWVKIITLKINVGPGTARNMGWDAARGKFLAFLDADDAWHPRKIELQHDVMVNYSEASLCAHATMRIAHECESGTDTPSTSCARVTKAKLLLSNRFITPAVMLRREIPYRFRPGRRHMEDHLLWMEMACDRQILLKMEAVLAYTFKAPFGESGLSGELWNMEKAELDNYAILYRAGRINALSAAALLCLSVVKFLRRLIVAVIMKRS
jgi:glycosyltransferase involved in cell wall biosynthesis